MKKIGYTCISLFVLFVLLSCKASLTENLPDLGPEIDLSQLNTLIKISVPKECNSFKLNKEVCLQIINLSEKNWEFNVKKGIQIFQLVNNEWRKVSDKAIDQGAIDMILGPKGDFPNDKRVIPIFPDIKSDQAVFLRIFVIVYNQDPENLHQNTAGAFVDVTLKP